MKTEWIPEPHRVWQTQKLPLQKLSAFSFLPACMNQYCIIRTNSCLALQASRRARRGPEVRQYSRQWYKRTIIKWQFWQAVIPLEVINPGTCIYIVVLRKAKHPQTRATFEILVWFQWLLLRFTFLSHYSSQNFTLKYNQSLSLEKSTESTCPSCHQ